MKTIVFDFDGVIHSYMTPWQPTDTVETIKDPPVEGIKEAIDELKALGYEIIVVSTRCAEPAGVEAIKNYLNKYNIVVDNIMATKPPAVCYVDDRAVCFDGNPQRLLNQIKAFIPWNRKERY